jgi:acyl carrier protein
MAAPLTEVTAIIREMMHDRDLDLASSTRFDELTDWDSMDLVTVVVEAECRFDLRFALPEIDRLVTLGDLVRMIGVKHALEPA